MACTTNFPLTYFDTTLATNGKPIWWTGSNWVDADGTVVQYMFRPITHDLEGKIAAMVDSISKLTLMVEKNTMQQESLMRSHGELDRRVDKNEAEIRRLENTSTKVETVSQLARWGGIALISAILGSWLTLSSRVDMAVSRSDTNSLNITQLQVDNKATNEQLADLQKRVTDNREAIISALQKDTIQDTNGKRTTFR